MFCRTWPHHPHGHHTTTKKNNSDNDKSNTNDHEKQQRQQQTQQQQPQTTTTVTTTRAITTRRTAASAATAMVTTSATTAPATATTTTDNSKHNEMATSKSICQMFRFLNVVIAGMSHNFQKSIFPNCPENKSFDNFGARNFKNIDNFCWNVETFICWFCRTFQNSDMLPAFQKPENSERSLIFLVARHIYYF